MAASSTLTSTNISIDDVDDVVVLTGGEWAFLSASLICLANEAERAGLLCSWDADARDMAHAVTERTAKGTSLAWSLPSGRGPLVTLELDVHEDATDAELLVAARRALAADTEAVTA